jgi:outer membrane protein TolC
MENLYKMNSKNKYLILFALLLISSNLYSQKSMKIEDAIAIGLKNNYDIQLGKIDVNISKTNNTAGNAGMNPNINLNVIPTYTLYNTHLEYSNGNISDNSANGTFALTSGVGLNWTVFDGFKMFVTKERLNEIEKLGELSYQNTIQNAVANITTAFYDIIRQKQILKNIQEIKSLAKERLIINETRFSSGLSAKTDLLQTQIDYNTHCENELLQENTIKEAKRNLLELINFNEQDIEIDGEFVFSEIDSVASEKAVLENNYQLSILQKQMEIAKLSVKETEALDLPTISLNAGYNFNITQTSTGLVNYNRGTGPQIGAVLTYPIYLGGNITRQQDIANLNYISYKLEYDQIKAKLKNDFANALANYNTQKKLLKIEAETKLFAKENLFLSIERLKLSQTTSLELRDAQLMYENSLTRFSNIGYNLKAVETKLKLLMGKLQ